MRLRALVASCSADRVGRLLFRDDGVVRQRGIRRAGRTRCLRFVRPRRPTLGPAVPPATAVAAPVPADQLPTASGAFGEKPTLTFPAGNPVPSLQRVILSEGTGPVTEAGDWLITNYLGQIWGGEVFDNSYDRGHDLGLPDRRRQGRAGLGHRAGRGPGRQPGDAEPAAGGRLRLGRQLRRRDQGHRHPGLRRRHRPGRRRQRRRPDRRDACSRRRPTRRWWPVRSASPATVTIPAGLAEPTAPSVAVLATGTGAPVALGNVLVQYTAVTWTGESAGTTWPGADPATSGTGPQELPVATGGPFAGLVGVPLGSRVLVQVPGQTDPSTGQPSPAIAAVVDLILQTSASG